MELKELVKVAIGITCDWETEGDPYRGVTGNFDAMGISLGCLQWNYGMGSLQSLTKQAGEKLVTKYMPTIGKDFWAAANMSNLAAVKASLKWQKGNTVSAGPKKEMQAFMGCEEVKELQVLRCMGVGDGALRQASSWAKQVRGESAQPTVKEFCWFFDLIVMNGGLKGLNYSYVKDFIDGHGDVASALDFICDWMEDCPKSEYARKESLKNSTLWRDQVEHIELLSLSYLRALKSRQEFRRLVVCRKGTIACSKGYVNGELYDLKQLKGVTA